MNLKEIRTRITFGEVWMIPLAGETPAAEAIGRLETTSSEGIYKFITGARMTTVKCRNIEISADLYFHIKKGCAHLAEVVQIVENGGVMFKVVFFRDRAVEMDTVEIDIKKIKETAGRHEKTGNPEKLAVILRNKCVFSDGKNTWFLINIGPVGEQDYPDTSGDAPNDYAFTIRGEDMIIQAEKQKLNETDEIYSAGEIDYSGINYDVSSFYLAREKLVFSETVNPIGPVTSGALRGLKIQEDSYITAWDKYAAEEGDLLLQKAKKVGKIYYTMWEQASATTIRITTAEKIPRELSAENDELEIVSEKDIPDYLKEENTDMGWKEYAKILEARFMEKKTRPVVSEIISIGNNSIVVDDPGDPPSNSVLILAAGGDTTRFIRQILARKAVKEGRSANTLLGKIIGDGVEMPKMERITDIKITPFVAEKIFKNLQRKNQQDAVEIALNTPDIAIIQGPPGTGKTTVIAAIIERLNEVYNKRNSIRGMILVTGFQHDAVENIISRLSVNSLPAVKFGKRSGETEERGNIADDKLKQWADDIRDKINKKNPDLGSVLDRHKLRDLIINYSVNPSKSLAAEILKKILKISRDIIPPDIVDEADSLRRSLQAEDVFDDENKDKITAIRAIRSTKESFEDDGSHNARILLDLLRDSLLPREASVLGDAVAWKNGDSMPFLNGLKALQISLLGKYNVRAEFSIEKPRKEIIDIAQKANAALLKQKSREKSVKGKIEEILAGFLNELANPEEIKKAVKEYTFVYAATTQGAARYDIVKEKNAQSFLDTQYDTVIIDEAARASPLELLIPMVQAEKRIILVGDHRQLPHIYDDDIIREAQETGDSDGAKVSDLFESRIKRTMFEHLKERLEKMAERDDIRRTITLDKQFRMHPELGDFVSKYFYEEPSNGKEKFGSPRPENDFKHNLPDLDGPMLWIDIPGKLGTEEQDENSPSTKRSIEAEVIAGQLKTWLDSEAGRNLTFGVISFYKAQSNLILEELASRGITEKDGKSWKIKEEYAYLEKQENGRTKKEQRLRVGTVDAFQGMEFDVVFLSMVRSPKYNIPVFTEEDKKTRKAKYEYLKFGTFGYLVSPNRLCVSMSRQKRVLVVAGDADLVLSPIGMDSVPALHHFCKMCREKGLFREYSGKGKLKKI